MNWVTAFGEEEAKLRGFYPNEPLYCNDPSFWYAGDVYHLFAPSDTFRLPNTVHVHGFGEAAPYWKPEADMHEHMRAVVAEPQNMKRLVLPTQENRKKPNPNFRDFPVNYGLLQPQLAGYEIDDTVRVASLTHEKIEIEKANYLDQLATNIWPDRLRPGTEDSLRASETTAGRLSALRAQSCFANTLGAALVLIDLLL